MPSFQGQRNSSVHFNIDQVFSLCVYIFDRQEGASIIDEFVRNVVLVGGQVQHTHTGKATGEYFTLGALQDRRSACKTSFIFFR